MRKVVPTSFPSPWLNSPMDFGDAIRAARTQSGLTIAEAALSIGVAKQTLQDLEKGVGTVNIGLAMKIANDVGVSMFAVPSSQRSSLLHMLQESEDSVGNRSDVERPGQ